MQVLDVMTVDVATTTPETTLREAAVMLAERGISGMPVVSAGGEVLGVISEADVLAKEQRVPEDERGAVSRLLHLGTPAANGKHEARLVGEAMSTPAVLIPSFASIATAAGRMLEHGVNRLPVVNGNRLVGIVSRADLVRAFARSDDEIAADARTQVERQLALVSDPGTVDVAVADGETVLTGAVRRRSEADILARMVRCVPGVVEVRSELSWSVDE